MGRVQRPGEPLWLPDDIDVALAYFAEKAMECPGCGRSRDETMDPQAEGRFRAKSMRCFACQAQQVEADRFAKQNGDTRGLLYAIEEREP